MMEEEKEENLSAAEAGEELEFRPWVKWAAVGAAGAVSLAMLLFAYDYSFTKGYQRGATEGFTHAIQSGQVQDSLNKVAQQNVLSFLRLSAAPDSYLLQQASNTAAAFSWIKDEQVRREAEWYLAEALLERRKADAAAAVLTPLFQAVPHTAEWAYRALRAGEYLVALQHPGHAAAAYQKAVELFVASGNEQAELMAMAQLVALEIYTPRSAEESMKAWQKLHDELMSKGERARHLRAMLLVHMGMLCRSQGDKPLAESYFRSALQGADPAQVSQPEFAVHYGIALLELGNEEAAEPLLRRVERNTGTSPAEVMARISAMRQLAVVLQNQGHLATALALLNKAQGVAEGRLAPANQFWPVLFDQRGWMHFMAQDFHAALQDFNAALACTQDPRLLIQPLEGAARCYLEMGELEQALPLLENCLHHRNELTPGDASSLGRINLLLGQIYDQKGRNADAEAAYGAAIARLTGDAPDEVDNRRLALLGRAYALSQLRRWQEAYSAWEQLLPLLEQQRDRREEARNQMRRIKSYIPGEPNDEELTDTDEEDEEARTTE